jgi:hypothetical protein
MGRAANTRIGSCARVSALLIVVLSCWAIAHAEPHETIVNNGAPQLRVDIAIVGDGYTAGEMTKYRNDALQFVQGWFAQDPYREYQRYFNVHRVDVVSNQSGADHPETGTFVDTAFDAAYNCGGTQRLICVNQTKVFAALQRSLAPNEYDIRLVIVNDAEYGGSGGNVAVASTNAQAVELILHEVGHSFALLLDEYGGSQCGTFNEPNAPNITTQTARSQIKWNYWIDGNTSVPTTSTSPGVPGLYQGGWFCDHGYYRPTYDSKMRTLGRAFDQINTEQLVKRIYNIVSPIESSTPSLNSVALNSGESQLFLINSPSPLSYVLDVTWFVDGQPRGAGKTFFLNASMLGAGTHSLDALVRDNTTWVRRDNEQLLSETRHWTLSITGSPAPPPPVGPPPTSAPFLVPETNSPQRAVALNAVTMVRDPFSVFTTHNLSGDHRTRILLYAQNIDWNSLQNTSALTAQADFGATVIPMVVEYIGFVPGVDEYARIVLRLPDGLPTAGDVGVRVAVNGVQSNRVLIGMKP